MRPPIQKFAFTTLQMLSSPGSQYRLNMKNLLLKLIDSSSRFLITNKTLALVKILWFID